MAPHLFVDISSHGFGHLAQVAPILNELARLLPDLRLTVRSGLPLKNLRARIDGELIHIAERSDFGFVMHDAVNIDFAATATAYRSQHANWAQRVGTEADLLGSLRPDLVLTDVAYLPLAGAAKAGIPSLSMCSLNWAELFAYYFGAETWAPPILSEILEAYAAAECFLRLTPAMPMTSLPRLRTIAPVAALGQDRRTELRARLGLEPDKKIALIAFGGFDKNLGAECWLPTQGLHWLVPGSLPVDRADMTAIEPLSMPFPDLLRSADVVLTKPGYGTFSEAACNGTPVLYIRRDNWPEQACLIDWLEENACCREIAEIDLISGRLHAVLESLWQQTAPPIPEPSGAKEAAEFVFARLKPRETA